MSRPLLKSCILRYAAVGWTGYVPGACRNTVLVVPANVARWVNVASQGENTALRPMQPYFSPMVENGLTESIGLLHYRYDPNQSDQTLFERGYNRIYDTLEPANARARPSPTEKRRPRNPASVE